MYRADEAAQKLNVKPEVLFFAIAHKKLNSRCINGIVYIHEKDLKDWLIGRKPRFRIYKFAMMKKYREYRRGLLQNTTSGSSSEVEPIHIEKMNSNTIVDNESDEEPGEWVSWQEAKQQILEKANRDDRTTMSEPIVEPEQVAAMMNGGNGKKPVANGVFPLNDRTTPLEDLPEPEILQRAASGR